MGHGNHCHHHHGHGHHGCGHHEHGCGEHHQHSHHHHDHDCGDRHGCRDEGERGCDFDEKRVVDLIVGLVTEQVGRMMQDQQARSQHDDHEGGEKRIVDLIVGLVSEHVREIVAEELDRRLGKPEPEPEKPAA